MRNWILLLGLITVSSFLNAKTTYDIAPNLKLTGLLFPTYEATAITFSMAEDEKVFGNLTGGDDRRIRKVPSSILSPLGIKKGDIFQCWNLDKKQFLKYIINESVYVVLFEPQMGSSSKNSWNRYNLALTDDPKELERISTKYDMEFRDGFCYVGKEFDLEHAYFEKITLKVISSDKQLPKDVPFNSNTKDTDLRVGKVYNNLRYIFFNKNQKVLDPGSGALKMDKAGYYPLIELYPSLTSKDRGEIEVLRLSNSQKIIFIEDGDKLCLQMNFVSSNSLQKVDTKCGGEWGIY